MVDNTRPRPPFDELPLQADLKLRHSWDVSDHRLGSLANLTADRRLAALAECVTGESIGLSLPLGFLDPPLFGRARHRHEVVQVGRNDLEDVLHDLNPQAGSQWDGLQHVRAREAGFFGGYQSLTEAGGEGISAWADAGIVGRGVLLDVARWWSETQDRAEDPRSGRSITPDELDACAQAQGVELRPGDILCLRTGWVEGYRSWSSTERDEVSTSSSFVGLHAGEPTARWLWDRQVAAVVADNPALECGPGDRAAGSLHRRLIPLLGIVIGELFDLDPLAERCHVDGRWSFLFSAVPLPLVGGVSSTANAVAVL